MGDDKAILRNSGAKNPFLPSLHCSNVAGAKAAVNDNLERWLRPFSKPVVSLLLTRPSNGCAGRIKRAPLPRKNARSYALAFLRILKAIFVPAWQRSTWQHRRPESPSASESAEGKSFLIPCSVLSWHIPAPRLKA